MAQRDQKKKLIIRSCICKLNFLCNGIKQKCLLLSSFMSCWKHGYPWSSLATFPYRSSPQAGLLDNILYPHIVAECMFVLVVLLLHGYVWGVHKSTSLMSSSLLLQQCLACLVRLTWIVFVIKDRWPYSWCLVGCCRQDLFKIACSILV